MTAAETRRIVRLYRSATDSERAEGETWYCDAHQWCADAAERHGLSVDAVAGIVAALSPRSDWTDNLRRAEQLMSDGYTYGLTLGRERARRIAAGADPAAVLGGPKVRAFYFTIADPNESDAVVIDRHAFDAVIGRVTDDRARKVLNRKGEYEHTADVYRSAARILEVRPWQVQAVVWVVWRRRVAQPRIREIRTDNIRRARLARSERAA